MWWSTLNEAADLLDAQEGPLSPKQIDHMRHQLFGGMGSFQDYSVDTNKYGERAKDTNQRLSEKQSKLFQLFE